MFSIHRELEGRKKLAVFLNKNLLGVGLLTYYNPNYVLETNNFLSAGCATANIISRSKNCHVRGVTWFLMAILCILLVRRPVS